MKKSIFILILIGIFSILSMVVFAQPGDNTGVSVMILEEPTIVLSNGAGETVYATLNSNGAALCEINWDGIFEEIIGTSDSYTYSDYGLKTVYYRCYAYLPPNEFNFVTVNDSILIQLIITCLIDADCGTDGWVGSLTCSNDDVWQDYITYTCNNAGTPDSYCSNLTAPKLKEDCGEDYCEDWESNYCKLDDVYHNKTCHDKGCLDGACFDNTYIEEEKVQDCGEDYCEDWQDNYCEDGDVYHKRICHNKGCSSGVCFDNTYEEKQLIEECIFGCVNGECNECSLNSDCGTDGWVGSLTCSNDDVWQDYITYTCNDPGTSATSCSDSTAPKLKEDCGEDYCESWGDNYCKDGDVYHKRICHNKGCSSGVCYDNLIIDEQKVQDCTNGCTEGRCKVEVCKTICNFGVCYEYCVWQ